MQSSTLKECLRREGATLVGVGDVTEALTQEIIHLNRGVSLAVNKGLSRDSISHLRRLQKLAEGWLRGQGYRSLSIPPDSDRIKGKYISKLYHLISHKGAAQPTSGAAPGRRAPGAHRPPGGKGAWIGG